MRGWRRMSWPRRSDQLTTASTLTWAFSEFQLFLFVLLQVSRSLGYHR